MLDMKNKHFDLSFRKDSAALCVCEGVLLALHLFYTFDYLCGSAFFSIKSLIHFLRYLK